MEVSTKYQQIDVPLCFAMNFANSGRYAANTRKQ